MPFHSLLNAAPSRQTDARSVHLSAASRSLLGRIAENELGELALVTAALALLIWKHFRASAILFQMPALSGTPGASGASGASGEFVTLMVEIDPVKELGEFLEHIGAMLEEAYNAPSIACGEQHAHAPFLVTLHDNRIHDPSTPDTSASLRICTALDQGEVEIAFSEPVEAFLVEGLADGLADILTQLEDFEQPLKNFKALSAREWLSLSNFSEGPTLTRSSETVVEMFEAQAARTPDQPALLLEDRVITYAKLNGKANALARRLREEYALGPESMVGVMLDRSEAMIVAVLGILKAGAAFVPIDSSYPVSRIRDILNDTALPLLLTQSDKMNRWFDFAGQILFLDQTLPGWQPEPDHPHQAIASHHLAYVIYTSGSTGKPKGVLLEHRNLSHYIRWACDYYFTDKPETGSFGLYSSLSFDFTLTNLFCPLVRGKSLRIYPQSQNIQAILEHAFEPGSGIDTLKLTPSHVSLLEFMDVAPSTIRKIIVGGEELTPHHIAVLRRIDRSIDIYNEYGPTEATVGCIVWRVEDDVPAVLIGRPITNTRVAILDEDSKPVPLGVRGEIYIAGDGLARGYHNRPDITADRFITSPLPGGDRLYRTGDIGRWLPEGLIQCFGRTDSQVKIRGYRVELGEIEGILSSHPQVCAAAVVYRRDSHGTGKLIAFTTLLADFSAQMLREWLAQSLPDYMVPSEVHVLQTLPLNTNGKIDRTALQHFQPAAVEKSPTQITATQESLLGIWRETFDTPDISIEDKFFDLGGDSLLSVQIVSRIWSAFRFEISIDDIFELQTIVAISCLIDSAQQPEVAPAARLIPPAPRTAPLPLSFSQQRLWFLSQLEETSAYHLSSALRIEGALEHERIEAALSQVVRRHEILRTAFPELNGLPSQEIKPYIPVSLPLLEASSEQDATVHFQAFAEQPFDLARGPLFRAVLYRVQPGLHILGLAMHHIISDAWSSGILIREITSFYQGVQLPDLTIQYADYARWEREQLLSPAIQQQLEAQTAALRGAPGQIELPLDHPRPQIQTFAGDAVTFHLDAEVMRPLRSLAQASGATPFMLLLSAYALLLSRYSNQQDIVIGSPVANRTAPESEPLIGFFVNTVAFRIVLEANDTFRDLLAKVKQVALEGYARQQVPFEQIVDALQPERNLSRTPVFQVMFAYETEPPTAAIIPGLTVSSLPLGTQTAKFDLTLYMQDSGSDIEGTLEFNTAIFERSTIKRMAAHLRTLLAGIAADPNAPIDTLPMLSPEERILVTRSWNQTQADFPSTPVHSLFEQHAKEQPNAVAVTLEDISLTYGELNLRSNKVARQLLALGVAPGTLVGVAMERSLEMIVALLAILKAGGAYVPIDPEYPGERLSFMLRNSQVSLLLTQPHIAPALPPSAAQLILLSPEPPNLAFAQNPSPAVGPDHTAYMIYTSGSTGQPKGALNSHRALTNRLLWMQSAYRLTSEDVILQKTPFSFDVSVWEFFWPLLAGASIVFAKPGGHRESDYLVDLIGKAQVTTLHFVPSMLRAFLEEPGAGGCTSLKRVICSGEALPLDLQQKFFDVIPAELHNLYGPTEAAIDVTFWQCRPGETRRTVPIGRPIANTQIYIVDKALQPTPIGVPGELLIGGTPVGQGYFAAPELTAAKFIPDHLGGDPQARLYRTGDLARFTSDGVIEFLGRLDHQVKVRGFRIELGEIEETLRTHPQVRDCVVVAKTEAAITRLVAYIATSASPSLAEELRAFLKDTLPAYMVPAAFVILQYLPLLPNGKINRKALPEPTAAAAVPIQAQPASTPREKILASIWCDVLQLTAVDVHANFFELGGDSILGLQVVARANQAGLHITARQIFQHQTIATLAAAAGDAAIRSNVDPTGPTPLTPIQLWFFQQELPEPSLFTQSVLLEVPANTDAERLSTALLQLCECHAALRLRFHRAKDGWQQFIPAATVPPDFETHTLATPSEMEQLTQAAEARIDIVHGPLLAARLFTFSDGSPSRLFFTIHHLAVDGVSWRILLEDLYRAYHQQPLAPPATSFREWSLHLRDVAKSPSLADEVSFWQQVPSCNLWPTQEKNLVSEEASCSFELDEHATAALLRQAPRTYNASIQELLVAALAQGVASTTGHSRVTLDVERHGRHASDPQTDLSRTVGWFTTIYPVSVSVAVSASIRDSVPSVREQLRRIPEEGFHYPILRYLAAPNAFRDSQPSPILFNYHGQIDTALQQTVEWKPASEIVTPLRSLRARRSHLFEIISAVSNNRLQVEWHYNSRLQERSAIEALASNFQQQLIALCHPPIHLQSSPAIVDSYTLSPLQEGMLFHSLYHRDPSAYCLQFSFPIEGAFHPAALRQAWKRAMERHEVLRTSFMWDGLRQALQVIAAELELPWKTLDCTHLDPDEHQKILEDLLLEERELGFDLLTAPLFRCLLIQWSPVRWTLCWTTHHILMDGWSTAILLSEILEDYVAIASNNTPPERATPTPYRTYIDWLALQPESTHENWWRQYLQGLRRPTPLPGDRSSSSEFSALQEQSLVLEAEFTSALTAKLRTQHLTLNTLLRGTWSLILSAASGLQDVTFGVTVSGRPPHIPGVEAMVGLFIHTLPLRCRIDGASSFHTYLDTLQAEQAAMDHHTAVSLIDLQRWSGLPNGSPLFESLFVFENYPVASPAGIDHSGLTLGDIRTFDQTNYPLAITITPGQQLNLRIAWDPRRLQPGTVNRIFADISRTLERYLLHPEITCADLIAMHEPAAPMQTTTPPKTSAPSRMSVTPRDEIESKLLAIWEDVLDRTGVGITDDYFDLGGHSIMAVRLMNQIEITFQRRLPIAQLFQNPTVEQLAVTLRDSSAISTNGIVKIRSGHTGTPILLLPGAGGNVLYFNALAQQLRAGPSIYGLEPPGLNDAAEPLATVEAIAAHHLANILPIIGDGPCALAGHSFGSSVALEMARLLNARGNTVEWLAIFDSTAPTSVSHPYWQSWTEIDWLLAIIHEIGEFLHADLNLSRQDLEDRNEEERLTLILDRIARQSDWLAGADTGRLRAYLRVYQSNFRTTYQPEAAPLPIPITLFRATESGAEDYAPSAEVAALRADSSWGWSAFSCRPVAVIDLPGNHLTMLLPPHVSVLSSHINAILERTSHARHD
ncbi:non-ribosomal peptide synthetase [Acidobacterium capsulatum]|uniref:Nonribosomal peptide synthetase n=1 Tax=Acidobacterium capsulatum (strain ATCC 51196 / DSM 11244 / BCRC 80197 / JCM 7670 / NBRC 15755 / NCIMB 13165 / 161) TaxID=240015 RepID=C1F4P2_ACIC5|nr:non-ribosomal peptide synthetase [Acidobacterium capsulatum]ACO32361.1 nonribosomal peptide synthetase [Acidobacterium capsulatum ATCC 51196]